MISDLADEDDDVTNKSDQTDTEDVPHQIKPNDVTVQSLKLTSDGVEEDKAEVHTRDVTPEDSELTKIRDGDDQDDSDEEIGSSGEQSESSPGKFSTFYV